MKAIVVSAFPPQHAGLSTLAVVLDEQLAHAGYDQVEHFDVEGAKLGFCQGELDCWLRHPGRCKIDDGEQAIISAIPSADALVFLGPVVFGGWGHALKRAIDRIICLVTPFFQKRAALTHHERRYESYPRMYGVGMLATRDPEQQTTFQELNDANALNFFAPRRNAAVLCEDQPELWVATLAEMLAHDLEPGATISDRELLRRQLLEVARADPPLSRGRIKTAALLVGSAKTRGTSASEHIARALLRRLEARGVACDLHFATEFVHERAPALAAAHALAAAELLVLVTPLYVDALPSLATLALELIARERLNEKTDAVFMPLINCGFPEPEHTRTAIRIARHFAAAAGYGFAGALPLGAGGMVTPDRDLDEPRPPVAHVVRALTLAADALAAGGSVPEAALAEIVRPALRDNLYRLVGDLGFRWQAHQLGTTQRELRAMPFSK
jgi:multimeric flavodoxin WrbA